MGVGRPLKFGSTQELQEKIDAYFAEREKIQVLPNGDIFIRPLTITGLAIALDTTRQTLMDYEKLGEYTDTIRRAKQKCEDYAEQRLYLGPATGPIFALKNFDWKDTQDINQNNTGAPQVIVTKNYIQPTKGDKND